MKIETRLKYAVIKHPHTSAAYSTHSAKVTIVTEYLDQLLFGPLFQHHSFNPILILSKAATSCPLHTSHFLFVLTLIFLVCIHIMYM